MRGTYTTFVASHSMNARENPEEEKKEGPNTPKSIVRCHKDITPFAARTHSRTVWGILSHAPFSGPVHAESVTLSG